MTNKLNYWSKGLLVLFAAVSALAFMGCPMEEDNPPSSTPLESDSPLIGTWELSYGGGGSEVYKIDAQTLQKGSGIGDAFVSSFEAKIHEVQYFTDSKESGMLYIEYTGKKPQYYSYAADYSITGGPFAPPGNFTVVMFHDLKTESGTTTIKLADPYRSTDSHTDTGTDGSSVVTYHASEVSTLVAAKDKFNIDTESYFLYSGWDSVSAQTKADS